MLRSLGLGRMTSMEVLMTILILVLLAMVAAQWGVDSRPLDVDRHDTLVAGDASRLTAAEPGGQTSA